MNIKALIEQRDAKLVKLNTLLEAAGTETRAFTDAEKTQFNALEAEIRALNETIEAAQRAAALDTGDPAPAAGSGSEETASIEERAFANYLRGVVETRADVNLTKTDNGAVIPSTIANKIIQMVYDVSPLYSLATRYNIGGMLSVPYYDESTQKITMAYATEFVDLTSSSGKFTSIELTGYLAGALTKVSKSLINNSQFDIVSFVVRAMAEAIARWIESELLNGSTGKIEGLDGGVKQKVTAAKTTEITADELIDLQETIPDLYQAGAIWIMAKKTRTAIRKLKDGEGNYLLNKDATARWGYTLFGKDVYVSHSVSDMKAKATAVYYGDMSGLAVKLAENMNIEVLRELYAAQHAVGVVAWMEVDSKVENAQKIAKLVMATA